jgi:hypothetical protein
VKALLDTSVLVVAFYGVHEHHEPSIDLLSRRSKPAAAFFSKMSASGSPSLRSTNSVASAKISRNASRHREVEQIDR